MSERSLNDAALCEFGKHWELDGDYIRCAECGRPQLASYAYKTFPHRSGCDAAGKVDEHPWHALRALLWPIASPAASDSRVPDGYVRVPIDPTSAMVGSAHCVDTCHGSWPREAWRAMLAAAPAPAAAPGSEPTAETPDWAIAQAFWQTPIPNNMLSAVEWCAQVGERARELAQGDAKEEG